LELPVSDRVGYGSQARRQCDAEPKIVPGYRHSQLEGAFDHVISTDQIKTFKPDPRAYQLGVDMLGVRKEEILFVASAGWDAAGAKWFGYPTFWNNRQRASAEELDATADGTGESLADLVRFLNARSVHSA
jgi:2-haloacid dehalogenase